MNFGQLDLIARAFAEHRLSRRRTLTGAGAGLAAGVLAASGFSRPSRAQDATPAAPALVTPPVLETVSKTEFLFVQSYRESNITTRSGDGPGDHTITLHAGLGQTIYFSNRPERIVGSVPTPRFLDTLGFPDTNPPNAALILTTGDTEQEIAVVELFNPRYDAETATATYDLEVLRQWASDGITLAEEPKDLAELRATFGTTHLFIDGCPDQKLFCADGTGYIWVKIGDEADPFCWREDGCFPCIPYPTDLKATLAYWDGFCNEIAGSHCAGGCHLVWLDEDYCPPDGDELICS